MRKLIGFLGCCFIVVLFSGCADLITQAVIAELEDRAIEKGKQNIREWATNNIPTGASEDDILQRLGTPDRKEWDFWIYPVPANVTKIPKGASWFVAIFFSDEKVLSWLGYGCRTGRFLEVSSQPSYKDVTVGISREAISVEKNELAYKGQNVWLLWKAAKVKYSFWGGGPGTEHTMAAIIFQNEKVAVIFCFRGYEHYGEESVVSPYIIITPEK